MGYCDDLLELAEQLANLEPADPRQACLRRAVSTAYYALFHLLISEATLNWGRAELRAELGRVFGHGKMKTASVEKRSELEAHFKKNPVASGELRCQASAYGGAHLYSSAASAGGGGLRYRERVDADGYVTQIEAVAGAFESWKAIREEPVAQAYLVSLLGKRPRPE